MLLLSGSTYRHYFEARNIKIENLTNTPQSIYYESILYELNVQIILSFYWDRLAQGAMIFVPPKPQTLVLTLA